MNFLSRTAVILIAVLPVACGPRDRVIEIRESRPSTHADLKVDQSSRERFGNSFSAPGGDTMGGGTRSGAGGEPFTYTLPPGWAKAPPAQFRDINLTAPGGVECWVSVLQAQADALAHLQRWHGQMNLPEATQADVDALPKVKLLGGTAFRVDLTGPGGQKRIIGSMLLAPVMQVFVKMQGSPAAVAAQLDAFIAFEASLGIKGGGTPDAGSDTSSAPMTDSGEPDIKWTVPAGWSVLGPAPMKLEQFGTQDGARAWLTLLSGDGGGLIANVTRWCGQIGKAPLSTAEIDALPRWTALGSPSIYVALLGDGEADGLLGLIIPLEQHSLYVKMSGPSDVLRKHEAEFRSFCEGLQR